MNIKTRRKPVHEKSEREMEENKIKKYVTKIAEKIRFEPENEIKNKLKRGIQREKREMEKIGR